LAYFNIWSTMVPLSWIGILCFSFGYGFMKPSCSAFLGDQFQASEDKERSVYFSWYYLSVQFGSIVSSIGIPILLQEYPDQAWISFAVLTAMLVFILPMFLFVKDKFNKKPVLGTNVFTKFLGVLWMGMTKKKVIESEHWLDKAKEKYDDSFVDAVKNSLGPLKVFLPLPFFWAIFFLMYSLWVFLAAAMNRTFYIKDSSFLVPEAEVVSLNPIMDIFLIPLFAKALYPLMRKIGFPLTDLKKMSIGLVFTSSALIVAGFVQLQVDAHPPHTITVLWIIPQFILISCAEIFLSVTAFEFAYSQAPTTMKGMLTALFLLTVALGNVLVTIISQVQFDLAIEYFAFAGFIFLVFLWFCYIAYHYTYADESQKATIN